jgi:NAD(P)-dependent dehydrogenase (short-subunit alcohol dehydrogenase family)
MTADAPAVVVVLGGSGLIGRAVVDAVTAGSAHHVVATYRRTRPRPAENTTWVHYDSAEAAGGAPRRNLGELLGVLNGLGRGIAAVIDCVGESSTRRSVADTPDDEWHSLFETNAMEFVRTYRALAPVIRRDGATVVVVGSATTAALPAGNGPYSASKAALEAVALTLAKEERSHGVRLALVAPSRVLPSVPEHMAGNAGLTPEQIGATIAAAALERNGRYRSGHIIRLGEHGRATEGNNLDD